MEQLIDDYFELIIQQGVSHYGITLSKQPPEGSDYRARWWYYTFTYCARRDKFFLAKVEPSNLVEMDYQCDAGHEFQWQHYYSQEELTFLFHTRVQTMGWLLGRHVPKLCSVNVT